MPIIAQDNLESLPKETVQASALTYSNRASMKFLKKDIKGAIQDFDKAIEISPQNPDLYLNRGYIKQVEISVFIPNCFLNKYL